MKLSAEDISTRLASASGWTKDGDALSRQFVFASFPDAIAFVTRLAFDAESADHHPDLTISYKRVTVRWSTHDEGGITEKDFAGARQSDTVARLMATADSSRQGA
jgi:4a-hydroxytetrahydrobiopterin dehydratase